MRIILTLVLFFGGPAFAAQYECSNKVSSERTEGARIESWPRLMVSLSYVECKDAGGEMSLCSGGGELLAHEGMVCYEPVDLKRDCMVAEGTSEYHPDLEVRCRNGIAMTFDRDINGQGKITCLEGGAVRKEWPVGACVEK